MKLKETIKNDYFQAMRDKNHVKKGVYSLLVSAINLKEKEENKELSDDEVILLVQKELKQAKETLDLTPNDCHELIDEANLKISMLGELLPKQMSEAEIKAALLKYIEENQVELIKKNQGVLMKYMMANYQGKTDGKSINQVLSSLLQ